MRVSKLCSGYHVPFYVAVGLWDKESVVIAQLDDEKVLRPHIGIHIHWDIKLVKRARTSLISSSACLQRML